MTFYALEFSMSLEREDEWERWDALMGAATADDQPPQPQSPPQLHPMLPPANKPTEARKYTADDWETQREEITRLYEDNTLGRVIDLMRENHHLIATYEVLPPFLIFDRLISLQG